MNGQNENSDREDHRAIFTKMDRLIEVVADLATDMKMMRADVNAMMKVEDRLEKLEAAYHESQIKMTQNENRTNMIWGMVTKVGGTLAAILISIAAYQLWGG